MSGVLDWAKGFETQSKQQVERTTKELQSALAEHERSIGEALRSSEQSISDATHALKSSAVTHVNEIRRSIEEDALTAWRGRAVFLLGMLGAMCLVSMLALGGSAWWLGLQSGEIREQRAVIAQLEELGGKVDLRTCQKEPLRLCVAVATDADARFTAVDGGQTYMVLEGY